MSETSKAKRKPAADKGRASEPDKTNLSVEGQPGKSEQWNLAEIALEPAAHAMATARLFNAGSFGSKIEVTETYGVLRDEIKAVGDGDLSHQRALLAGQAIALNSIFTEMSRRSALNMGEYLQASETYMRLALKAQAQSRATIEALDRLANGREQTVKHVHVDNRGGQAVIADNVHTGGQKNGKINEQSHALERMGPALDQPPRLATSGRDGTGQGLTRVRPLDRAAQSNKAHAKAWRNL